MQRKKLSCIARRLHGDFLGGATERARYRVEDVRQEGWLIAPRLGLRAQVARREIGRVGLEQQPLFRDFLDELEEVLSPALVADPAGDTDV